MKVGTENKKKLYAMAALMTVAVLLLLRMFVSSGEPTTTVAASVPNALPAQAEAGNTMARNTRGGKAAPLPLDPTLRTDLLRNSEAAEYKGTGRNIFEEQIALPEPKKEVVVAPPPPVPQQEQAPPPPPPIPLKFYGFANKPGQTKSIFLANGDDIFIGREGDIVNRRYKIIRIMQNQVEIEDVLNNNRQTIPLTQG